MAAKLDPHHLVALMSYAKYYDSYSYRMDPTSFCFQSGVTDDHETSIPTFPILDSIASICVSRETSQVVAIALQVDSNEHKINLTIAENEKVNLKLVAYLESVWGKLQNLSRLYAEWRKEEFEAIAKKLPEMPKDPTFPLRIQIFREIYMFSLAKQIKLMRKWWNRLVDFMKELATHRGHVLQGMEEDLFEALAVLHPVLNLVRQLYLNPAAELTQDDWELVYMQTTWANQKVRLVLADGEEEDGCEILAQELNDSPLPSEAFPLRQALKKLTWIPRHVESLFKFAHSPLLLSYLQYRLSISAVSEQNHDVELPSQEQWLSILEIAATRSLTWQSYYARMLSREFQQKHCLCPVHPECRLIQYLATSHGNQWDHFPAFSYIGISKPSCGACLIWMEASNQVGQPKFHTRASRGKWDWPWAMPMAEEPLREIIAEESSHEITPNKSLSETMAAKLSLEFISCLKEQDLFEPRSPSPGTLLKTKSHLTSAQEESISSHFAAARLEFGSMTEYLESILAASKTF